MILDWFTPNRQTWLHQVNPACKCVLLFTLLLLVFLQKNIMFTTVMLACYSILLIGFSGYPLRKILLLFIPFAISSISSGIGLLLFGKGQDVIWQWAIVKISHESIAAAAVICTKSLLIGVISLTLLLTTKPVLLFYALMQQLKFPAKFMYAFMAAIRLVPIMIEEIQVRTQALKVRRVRYAKGLKGVLERLKQYVIPLVAQSIRRAQRVAVAMEAKQFHMKNDRTYYYATTYSIIDVYMLLFVGSTIAVFFVV